LCVWMCMGDWVHARVWGPTGWVPTRSATVNTALPLPPPQSPCAPNSYTATKASIDAFNTANRWRKRGIAIIPVKYGIDYAGFMHGSAIVRVYVDGTVEVTTGTRGRVGCGRVVCMRGRWGARGGFHDCCISTGTCWCEGTVAGAFLWQLEWFHMWRMAPREVSQSLCLTSLSPSAAHPPPPPPPLP
jgi:hypothetical protein